MIRRLSPWIETVTFLSSSRTVLLSCLASSELSPLRSFTTCFTRLPPTGSGLWKSKIFSERLRLVAFWRNTSSTAWRVMSLAVVMVRLVSSTSISVLESLRS